MVGGTTRPGQDCYFFVYSRCFIIRSWIYPNMKGLLQKSKLGIFYFSKLCARRVLSFSPWDCCPHQWNGKRIQTWNNLNLGIDWNTLRCAPTGWQGNAPSLTAFSGTWRTRGAGETVLFFFSWILFCARKRNVTKCYWETQPQGCAKPHCPFLHQYPKVEDTLVV